MAQRWRCSVTGPHMTGDIPSIAQIIMLALSLVSTGFIGLLLHVVGKALQSQEQAQRTQTLILIDISRIQEQIKTLFSNTEQHRSDIEQIENHLHGFVRTRK